MKFLLSLAAALAVFLPSAQAAPLGTYTTFESAPSPAFSSYDVAVINGRELTQYLDAPIPGGAHGGAAPLEPDPYAAGQWRLSPFASYRVHELGSFDGKFGGGLSLSYAPAKNTALELETLSESFDDSHWKDTFTEAGANFKGYLPLGKSGLAPYALIGYTRNLLEDENRMNAGAGIEYRYKRVGVFLDGRWTHNFETIGHALFRLGGSLSF